MLPIILITSNNKQTEDFIQSFIEKNKFNKQYVSIVRPLKQEITIDQIRDIRRDLIIQFPSKRMIIVENFDTSSGEVQNAFLKTLEEKSEETQFILEVRNVAKILPTILSRSKMIKLIGGKHAPMREASKKLLDSLTTDNDNYAFLGEPFITSIDREDAVLLFDEILTYFHQHILTKSAKAAQVLKKTMETRELLLNNNLNPQLAIDTILIFIKKTYSMYHIARGT
ncbi:hypothetical protein HY358_00265 [Candidatus Roizmanbacteria bacterium]|nr:hypothetical protein [Candidatus Roizmanbacteria bacterium]